MTAQRKKPRFSQVTEANQRRSKHFVIEILARILLRLSLGDQLAFFSLTLRPSPSGIAQKIGRNDGAWSSIGLAVVIIGSWRTMQILPIRTGILLGPSSQFFELRDEQLLIPTRARQLLRSPGSCPSNE